MGNNSRQRLPSYRFAINPHSEIFLINDWISTRGYLPPEKLQEKKENLLRTYLPNRESRFHTHAVLLALLVTAIDRCPTLWICGHACKNNSDPKQHVFPATCRTDSMRYFSKRHHIKRHHIDYVFVASLRKAGTAFLHLSRDKGQYEPNTDDDAWRIIFDEIRMCCPSELSLINLKKNRQTVEGKTCSWKRKLFCSYTLKHSLLPYACIYIFLYIFRILFHSQSLFLTRSTQLILAHTHTHTRILPRSSHSQTYIHLPEIY